MHRPPFTRTKRRPRARRLWPRRALKNWLSRNRPSRSWPWWRSRRWQRRLVHRSRTRLGHDHSRRWRNRRRCFRGCRSLDLRTVTKRWRLYNWRRTASLYNRSRSPRRNSDRRRCGSRTCSKRCGRGGWSYGNFGRNHDHCWRPLRGSYRSWRNQSRRRRRGFGCGLGGRCLRLCWSYRSFRFHGWLRNRCLDCRARRRMLRDSFLLRDGAQHISRAGNMREVDLGLDLVFTASGTRSLGRTGRRLAAAAEMFPHQFRFMLFQRTGVRLFLRDAHRGQHVKNFLALDFQLTGQIIDSNLTHPLSLPLLVPLMSSI